ncbi:MAG TPA: T9SS type A sorting domain-containing protein [Chitinophagaceae bacterium]|nr:T9SS type A sorting domain-containing protein [Chitinophagaceae bacterium]
MKKIIFLSVTALLTLSSSPAQVNNKSARIVMTQGSYLVLNDIAFVNNGNFTQSAGTVKMMGSGNNTISGTVKPQFFSLVINKSLTKEVQLLTDCNVSNEILFISGLLNLNNRNIFLVNTATLKGESESNRVIGPAGGYIEVTTLLNAPVAANPGNLGAIISSSKNLGNTIIRRGHQSQIIGGGNSNSLLRYYEITPTTNIALNATLRFQYFDTELNGLAETNTVLFKKVNNINWLNQGFTLRSAVANYVIKNGINDFSRWTISTSNNTLRGANPPAVNTEENIYLKDNFKSGINKIFIENLYPTIGPMQSVYIKTGNINLQKMQVLLYDMRGKLILNQQINYQSQWLQLPSLLTAGMYKVVIQSGEWKYQQSFIKQ